MASKLSDIENRCWTKSVFRPVKNWPVSTLTYCFKPTGEIDGFWFDAGDGGDLTAHWKKQRNRLVIREIVFARGLRDDTCDFLVVQANQALVMDRCDHSGDWLYDPRMTEAVFKGTRP